MKNFFIKTVMCAGLLVILGLSTGCEADFWPLSLLQSDDYEYNAEERITLPDKTDEDSKEDYDDETTTEYTFYYPNSEKQFLVPVSRRIPDTEAIARTVLGELISTPELEQKLSPAGLSPSIPSNTTIRGINIQDGLATINFSASFLTYPEDEERLVMESILCSLKQFSSIEQVMLVVEGVDFDEFPGGTPGDTPLGPESRVNLEISDDVEDYQDYTAVNIYFAYHTGDGEIFYVPVTRVTDTREDITDIEEASVLELLTGPRRNSGLFTEIPSGTELLEFSLEDGLATVNLSADILNYRGGLTGEENIINQIVLTLTEHATVEQVKILIDGEEIKLPEGTDLTETFTRPEHFNQL